MITETTKQAILALLAVDAGANDDDRNRIARAIDGTTRSVMCMTQVEAARRLGVSKRTIQRYVRRGTIRTSADGRRIPEEALLAFTA